jgi:hypothetical protein
LINIHFSQIEKHAPETTQTEVQVLISKAPCITFLFKAF